MKNMQVRFRNTEFPGLVQTQRKLLREIQVKDPGTCSPMRSLPDLLLSSLSEHRVSPRNACKRNAVKKKIKYCLESSEESCCGVRRSEKFHNSWLQPEGGFFTRKDGVFWLFTCSCLCYFSREERGGSVFLPGRFEKKIQALSIILAGVLVIFHWKPGIILDRVKFFTEKKLIWCFFRDKNSQ